MAKYGAGEQGRDVAPKGGASGRAKRPWETSARLLVGEQNDGPIIDIGVPGPESGQYGGAVIGDGQCFARGEVYTASGRHGTALEGRSTGRKQK